MHITSAVSNKYQKDVICLSKHYLHLGASFSYLNPSNKKQGFISRLGKPVRCLGRGAYAFGIVTLAAPAGAIYHIFQGIACYFSPATCRASLRPRAFGHWNAALVDGKVFLRGGLMTAIGVLAIAAVAFAFSQEPVEGLALGALVSYLPLYKWNPISQFMFSPDDIAGHLSEPISEIDRYVKHARLVIPNAYCRKAIECLFDGMDLVKQLSNLSLAGRWLLQLDEVRTQAFHDALKSYCKKLVGLKTLRFEPSQVKAFVRHLLKDLITLKDSPSYKFLFKLKDDKLCKKIEDLDRWVQKKEKPNGRVNDEGKPDTSEKENIKSEESQQVVDKTLIKPENENEKEEVEDVDATKRNDVAEVNATKKSDAEDVDEEKRASETESDEEECFEEGPTFTGDD